MTAFTLLTENDEGVQVFRSDVVAVGTAIEFDRLGTYPADFVTSPAVLYPYPMGFSGVEFFTSDAGTTATNATGGSYAVALTSAASPQRAEVIDASIAADAQRQSSWTAPLAKLTITPTSITGATHWRAVVILYPQGVR